MERHRALDEPNSEPERRIEKMRVELQVYVAIQVLEQSLESLIAYQLVGRPDVGQGTAADVLQLEQLADGEVAVIHESGQLGTRTAQLLDNPRAIHDLTVRDIGHEFVDVKCAKGAVAFAEQRQFGV